VHALARSSHSCELVASLGAEPVRGDLQDQDSMEKGMRGCDVVFHCASALGIGSDDEKMLYKDNVEGTSNVLKAAVKAGVKRIVYTSSLTVQFDGTPLVNVDEEYPIPQPLLTYYATTKLLSEKIILESKEIEGVIVRLPLVWGGGDSIFPGLVKMTQRGIWLFPGGGYEKISILNVMNATAGLVAVAEKGRAGQVYNLCDDEVPTFRELFTARLRGAGCSSWLVGNSWFPRTLPTWLSLVLVFVLELVWRVLHLPGSQPIPREGVYICSNEFTANSQKVRKETGYRPVLNWNEGLVQEAAWIRGVMAKSKQPHKL